MLELNVLKHRPLEPFEPHSNPLNPPFEALWIRASKAVMNIQIDMLAAYQQAGSLRQNEEKDKEMYTLRLIHFQMKNNVHAGIYSRLLNDITYLFWYIWWWTIYSRLINDIHIFFRLILRLRTYLRLFKEITLHDCLKKFKYFYFLLCDFKI